MLYEKGVPFKEHVVFIHLGEQNEDWFLRINPNGVVPALKDGEHVINESEDIIDYVDKKMFWRLVIGYMSADDRINWFQILSFSNVWYGFDCIMVFFLIKICSYLSQKIGYDLYRSLCQFGRRQIDDIFLVLKNFSLFVPENRI